MALFKILRGSSDKLNPTSPLKPPFVDGYAYFTSDDGRFYVDVKLDNPPLDLDIVKDSGQDAGGDTIYRIEVARSAVNDAIESLQTLSLVHGATATNFDGSENIEIDIQADWEEANANSPNYIKNKPTIINIGITVDEGAQTLFITSPIENGDEVSY